MTEPTGLAPTAEMAREIAEMRRTLDGADLTAASVGARIAIQVRTDAQTILEDLQRRHDEFVHGRSDEDLGRHPLIVVVSIHSWLLERGAPREAEQRLRDVTARARRVQRVFHDEPQSWNYWESVYTERSRTPDRYSQAVQNYRDSLERRWRRKPERDFRYSLSSQTFATVLRRSDDPAEVEEGERITAENARWRTERYGPRHAFTMVAEANRILDALRRLEIAHDRGALTDEQVERVRELARAAKGLAERRREELGDHHGGAVKATSYQARALRMLGEQEEARRLAELARSLFIRHAKSDGTVLAVLGVLIAEGYAAEAQAAALNADAAEARGQSEITLAERRRVDELWETVSLNLDEAEATFRRWPSQDIWFPRVDALRERRPAGRS